MEKKDEEHSRCMEEEELTMKLKLDLERVLVEEVGQFGRYQFKAMAISLIFVIVVAVASHEYVFTTARIRTRCLIPECENVSDTNSESFVPSWVAHALPVPDDSIGFDNCHRFAYANNTSTVLPSTNDSCPANLFNKNVTVPCEAFVYENKDSVVYDLGLACDEWRRTMIGSLRTVGALFANPLTGFVSDRWGRRTALAINVINCAWIGLSKYFATSYAVFVIIEFTENIFVGGIYACVYILLMEMVGPKFRIIAGAVCCTFIVVGHVFLLSTAWAIPNWRYLTLAIYIPLLLVLPVIWFLAESIRWLMSKGHFEKAEKTLKEMASTNGKQLSTETLVALKEYIKSGKSQTSEQKVNKETWLVVLVFKHKPILLRCLLTPIWWITMTLVYYGLTINSVNLKSGDKFTNYLTVSLSEIPGFWISCCLVDRIGRKPVLVAGFWICAFSQVAFLLLPAGYVSLAIFMVGKCSISTVVTTLYVYTSELYPTLYRHRLVAFSSMMGRIGAILAPLTPAFGDKIPSMIFGCLCVVAGVLVTMTPETRGCKLPDTMEEAENIGKTHRFSK